MVYNESYITDDWGMKMDEIKRNLDIYYYDMNNSNKQKTIEMSNWIHTVRKYDIASDNNAKGRNAKGEHPILIKQQYVYVIDYGTNVGKEFKDLHLGLVIQNNKGNTFSDTVIVLPITDFKSKEKFDLNVHHKLYNNNFEYVDKHGLDKNPSKVKLADIRTVDKSRIGNRVGKVDKETYTKIMNKFLKIVKY